MAEVEPGSNAWAVSGRRTAHGHAVICNDSHRALDTPNVYWQCRVTCPDFDVSGATFPGLPGFPHFGFNGSVAWAITHGDADTQDLYLEQFAGHPVPDAVRLAAGRGATSGSRCAAGPRSPYRCGPPGTGRSCTATRTRARPGAQWTGTHRANRGFECLLPMLTAGTVAELADAQDGWVDPVNNLVCADTAAESPTSAAASCRCGHRTRPGGCPSPGWDDACEWTGTVPFAELPATADPEAGFVMTANNVITDADEPYISYTFSQPWRAERLRSLLAGARPAQRRRAGRDAGRHGVAGGPRLGPAAGRARARSPTSAPRRRARCWPASTATWPPASAAPLLYACFLRALAEALYLPVLGAETWAWMTSGALAPTLSMVRRWLGNDTWELLGGPVPPETPGRQAERSRVRGSGGTGCWRRCPVRSRRRGRRRPRRAAPTRSLAVGRRAPGGPGAPAGGPVPGAADGRGRGHPSGERLRMAGRQPVHGDHLSVYRQVVDLGAPGAASFVIPGGASGDPDSPHFADQFARWAVHQRIPMGGRPAARVGHAARVSRPQKTTTSAPMGRCTL